MLKKLLFRFRPFRSSEDYWKQRYRVEGDSGPGSYGKFASFKADVLNAFVDEHEIRSVIEFGCGDGNQLALSNYPNYTGFDVSSHALESCRSRFPDHTFKLMREYSGEQAELVLSLDVIFHLVEDEAFVNYMETVFRASRRYVIFYSSNHEGRDSAHVRHREFTAWISKNQPYWSLVRHIPNRYPYTGNFKQGSFADFYVFAGRREPAAI